ncbi:MAG: TVP38/TMEM64 family protein [Clostridia bacterium]|nr:TVP38/TMEM64 family protein [Clostridia bacterium]
MEPQEKKWKSIVPFCLIVAAICFVGIRWGKQIVDLVADPVAFRDWVDERGAWGQIVMILCITAQILVAFLPGEPFEFAAGYAFGAWQGLALCMIGSFIGGCLAMMLARRYGVRLVKALFPKNDISNNALFKNPGRLRFLTFILFLIPGTPKDFMIYALGLTPMSVLQAVGLTCIARIPSIITSTLSGHALGEENYIAAIIIYGLTGVASLIAILLYRRKTKAAEAAQQEVKP